jgi:2-desacetyl-2-hydroxyethyl bacteriochlorophyllide A dehydrogenase
MKQLVCNTPFEFEYKNGKRPTLKDGYAILKVKNIGICGTDLHAYEGTQPYFNYPRILGHELACEIVEIDQIEENQEFKVGEKVTFIPYFNCGKCIACRKNKPNCCTDIKVFGVHIDGGMCEYISVPTYALVHGESLQFEELALIEPLAIGLHAVRRVNVQPADNVLVVGAGPIGLGIMEFAKIAGANVTAMDVNDERLAFVHRTLWASENIGIKNLINPKGVDADQKLLEITNGDMPNVIFDATGSLKAINNAFQYLSHTGQYVLVGLQKGDISFSHPEFHKREATLMSSRNATRSDFEYVIECIKKGLIKPENYITHRVDFEQVKDNFEAWLNPANGVIKAMVKFN